MIGQLLFGHRGAGLAGRRPVSLGRWLADEFLIAMQHLLTDETAVKDE
jgi:hypothetical protein